MKAPIRLTLAVAAWLLLGLGLTAVSRAGDDCLVYTYMDSRGEMHKTARLDAVPPALRESMVTYRDCAKAAALRRQGPEMIPPPKGAKPYAEKPMAENPEADKPVVHGPAADSTSPTLAERTAGRMVLAWISSRPSWQVVLLILFWAASLAGELGIVVTAFRTGLLWGLGCLFFPLIGLFFVIVHWRDVWPSFLTALVGGAGSAILLLGY